MIRKRSARALAGGLVVVLLLLSGTAAYAAGVVKRFSGTTGQQEPISFRIAHGYLTHLQFNLTLTCRGGHQVTYGNAFPKFPVKHSKFDRRFVNKSFSGHAVVSGTVGKKVTGKIRMSRSVRGHKGLCSGSTRFTATLQK
jgi:hypothetical protein